jgi:hypothetical protein
MIPKSEYGFGPDHAQIKTANGRRLRARVCRRPCCSHAARTACVRRWREACCGKCSPGAVCAIGRRQEGELDPFAVAVMGRTRPGYLHHKPKTFEDLEDWEGPQFRSHHHAVAGGRITRRWRDAYAGRRCRILATPDPTTTEGVSRTDSRRPTARVCAGLSLADPRRDFPRVGAASG